MGLKNDRYYFSLLPSKRNYFLFKQVSLLQKLVFILVSLVFYGIILPAYILPATVLVLVFREPAGEMVSLLECIYNTFLYEFVFKWFIRFNYKLAWKDVVYKMVDESDREYGCFSEEAKDYWERRQIIIDRMAEIYDF
jgi:hypothetical protein